jgi:hypothetical protein
MKCISCVLVLKLSTFTILAQALTRGWYVPEIQSYDIRYAPRISKGPFNLGNHITAIHLGSSEWHWECSDLELRFDEKDR